MAGGIPPNISDSCSADAVYRAAYQRVVIQNEKYYSRFPADVDVVHRIVKFLAAQPEGGVRLSDGSLLTPRAFQVLGLQGKLSMVMLGRGWFLQHNTPGGADSNNQVDRNIMFATLW